jgi:hypothetical protein
VFRLAVPFRSLHRLKARPRLLKDQWVSNASWPGAFPAFANAVAHMAKKSSACRSTCDNSDLWMETVLESRCKATESMSCEIVLSHYPVCNAFRATASSIFDVENLLLLEPARLANFVFAHNRDLRCHARFRIRRIGGNRKIPWNLFSRERIR